MARRKITIAAVVSASVSMTVAGIAGTAQASADAPSGSAHTATTTPTGGAVKGTDIGTDYKHGTPVRSTSSHVVTAAKPRTKAATAAATPATSIGTAPNEFYFVSSPNDYIGAGQTVDITTGISASFAGADRISFSTGMINSTTWWDGFIAPPSGQSFALGTTYNATRSATATTAGLDVSGSGRGCNQTFGSVTVSEYATDASGALTHFAATFEQHCESPDAPALIGFIRFNATKPTSLLKSALTGSEVGTNVVADASKTTSNLPITNYHFNWGDSTDDTTNPVMTHFYAASGPHDVAVTVTDSSGNTSTTTTTINPDAITASATPNSALSVDLNAAGTSTAGVKSYDVDWGDHTAHGTNPVTTHTYKTPGTYPIVVTMTDNEGQVIATDTMSLTTDGSDYTSVSPTRIIDTRDGTGLDGATPKVTATSPVRLKVAGVNGVPANVTAVAVNVTVAGNESGFGALGVTPDGAPLKTSNLNYAPGQIVPNMVIVPVAADGYIEFQKLGPGQTDVIADLFGYYTPTAAQGFTPLDPYRALDTRNGTGWGGGRLATGKPIHLKVTGAGGVPATGVTAVAVNITVTETTAFGVVAAGPTGFTNGKTTWTSNLNYGNAMTIANMAIVPVGPDGYIDLVNQGPGTASAVLDINGYYSADGKSAYAPVNNPFRLYDTRNHTNGALPPQSWYYFGWDLDSQTRLPDPTLTAFVTNTTVANTSAGGFLTVFPDNTPASETPGTDATPPTASNLNWGPNQIVPNLVFARPGADGYFDFFNGTPDVYNPPKGNIDLIIDLFGYYSTF